MLPFRAGNTDKALMLSAAIKEERKIRPARERSSSSSEPQVPVSAAAQASAFFMQAAKLKHQNVKEIREKEPKYEMTTVS